MTLSNYPTKFFIRLAQRYNRLLNSCIHSLGIISDCSSRTCSNTRHPNWNDDQSRIWSSFWFQQSMHMIWTSYRPTTNSLLIGNDLAKLIRSRLNFESFLIMFAYDLLLDILQLVFESSWSIILTNMIRLQMSF